MSIYSKYNKQFSGFENIIVQFLRTIIWEADRTLEILALILTWNESGTNYIILFFSLHHQLFCLKIFRTTKHFTSSFSIRAWYDKTDQTMGWRIQRHEYCEYYREFRWKFSELLKFYYCHEEHTYKNPGQSVDNPFKIKLSPVGTSAIIVAIVMRVTIFVVWSGLELDTEFIKMTSKILLSCHFLAVFLGKLKFSD